MWSWARLAGAGRPNSGEPPPGLAMEGREEVEGLTRVRFVASEGWWSTGARRAGGAQAGWPRRPSA
jgi:hypothetical protein